MAASTIGELVAQARVLLQDRIEEYRFSDAELVTNLNFAFKETRRIRPDLFMDAPSLVPTYLVADIANINKVVAIDQQYEMALVYYMVGMAHLRDEESTSDARASAMLNKFTSQLLVAAS